VHDPIGTSGDSCKGTHVKSLAITHIISTLSGCTARNPVLSSGSRHCKHCALKAKIKAWYSRFRMFHVKRFGKRVNERILRQSSAKSGTYSLTRTEAAVKSRGPPYFPPVRSPAEQQEGHVKAKPKQRAKGSHIRISIVVGAMGSASPCEISVC
jgi:predicted small lipoprotein YifL